MLDFDELGELTGIEIDNAKKVANLTKIETKSLPLRDLAFAFCGNKNLRNKGNYFFVDDVPCMQCDYCGEQYFEARELSKIENTYFEILNNKKQTHKKLEIPIENLLRYKKIHSSPTPKSRAI